MQAGKFQEQHRGRVAENECMKAASPCVLTTLSSTNATETEIMQLFTFEKTLLRGVDENDKNDILLLRFHQHGGAEQQNLRGRRRRRSGESWTCESHTCSHAGQSWSGPIRSSECSRRPVSMSRLEEAGAARKRGSISQRITTTVGEQGVLTSASLTEVSLATRV